MASVQPSGRIQRITVILDEALEKEVVEQAVRLGAQGYLCSYCSGKPLHDTYEAAHGATSLVRVELLAAPTEAEAIAEHLQQLQRRHYPVTILMDAVTALP